MNLVKDAVQFTFNLTNVMKRLIATFFDCTGNQ